MISIQDYFSPSFFEEFKEYLQITFRKEKDIEILMANSEKSTIFNSNFRDSNCENTPMEDYSANYTKLPTEPAAKVKLNILLGRKAGLRKLERKPLRRKARLHSLHSSNQKLRPGVSGEPIKRGRYICVLSLQIYLHE